MWIKWRNSVFDRVFYDTNRLTAKEQEEVTWRTSTEGEMMVVRPGTAEAPIEFFSLSAELIDRYHGKQSIDTIAIPGVGSSDLGTAALAREVADVLDRPVIGVIPGYGALDMMSEGLGGWFDFGMKNRLRAFREAFWQNPDKPVLSARSAEQLKREFRVKSATLIEDEPESNSILNLLLRNQKNTRLLVGHSKGCLNISNALYAFVEEYPHRDRINTEMEIITFGCGITVPPAFEHLRQYVGTTDMLGQFNTPLSLRRDSSLHLVPDKLHTLGGWHPKHMPLEDLVAERDTP
jgi:hypothetical protein